MNYSAMILASAAICGFFWEAANLSENRATKVILRTASVMFGFIGLGYIMLQYAEFGKC